MKKLCVLPAAALLAGILASCASADGPMEAYAAKGKQGVQIVSQLYEKEYRSADGKLVMGEYSYTLPSMVSSLDGASDDPSSDAIVDVFNDGVEKVLKEESGYWDSVMDDAGEYYTSYGSEDWFGLPWTSEMSYRLSQTDLLISIAYEHYVFTGGTHGYTYFSSQLFAVKEGCFLSLAELTDDAQAFSQAVTDDILRQIDEDNLGYDYWNDYPTYVAGWMEGSSNSIFFLEDGSLEIIFPAYELASYAAGPQTFVVHQDIYEPCLNDYGRLLLGLR